MVAGADGAERAVYSGEEAWRCAQPLSGGAWDNPEEAKSRRVDSMAGGRRSSRRRDAGGSSRRRCQVPSSQLRFLCFGLSCLLRMVSGVVYYILSDL